MSTIYGEGYVADMLATYRCPDNDRMPDDVVGCGHVFDAKPDHEGLVDCPNCGIWFTPKTEPATVVSGVAPAVSVPLTRGPDGEVIEAAAGVLGTPETGDSGRQE